jgi:hypothetical protein
MATRGLHAELQGGRLADRWGRGIRYGDLPNDPDAHVVRGFTRREIVEQLMEQSERLHMLEELAIEFAQDEQKQVKTDELTSQVEDYLKSDPRVMELLQSIEKSKERTQRLKERHRALEERERKFLQLLRGLE